MSNLLQEIETQIAGAKQGTVKQNVGVVREIGDGVAKVEGLADVMLNEMIDFGNGVMGLALNLEETEVGAVILGDYLDVKEGQEVKTTGKLLSVQPQVCAVVDHVRRNSVSVAMAGKENDVLAVHIAEGQCA